MCGGWELCGLGYEKGASEEVVGCELRIPVRWWYWVGIYGSYVIKWLFCLVSYCCLLMYLLLTTDDNIFYQVDLLLSDTEALFSHT